MKLSPLALLFAAALTSLGACAPRSSGADDPGFDNGDGGMSIPGAECDAKQTRCSGLVYQTCSAGKYVNNKTCATPNTCDDTLGCVACRPGRFTCSGDELHNCQPDGTVGNKVDQCAPGQCKDGACLTGSCGAGADLIYVVDQEYHLLSFNPKDNKNEFKEIGTLSCPAGPALSGGTATPFSMSVARDGTAWVLYTSGEIFNVNTSDASCKKSNFMPSQQGMDLFGMGFVTNGNGATDETLYITGGDAADAGQANLFGNVNPKTLQVTKTGTVAIDEYAPELTGTGKGELWAYFPGSNSTKVAQLDKSNGNVIKDWKLGGLGNSVAAWAFAHWGGRYYIFVTTSTLLGTNNSQVFLFDPALGTSTRIMSNLKYTIVGAGVSTCAPVILG